ncbi:unnamed protein product [Anisakis simplex]|uniref:Uncharacterized protein n=1 Tax=Anisakis simplex TaxID=6269 RepID=A0A0M3J4M6_ANISI|nr:unnamed protein product [Anisakis simplex]
MRLITSISSWNLFFSEPELSKMKTKSSGLASTAHRAENGNCFPPDIVSLNGTIDQAGGWLSRDFDLR